MPLSSSASAGSIRETGAAPGSSPVPVRASRGDRQASANLEPGGGARWQLSSDPAVRRRGAGQRTLCAAGQGCDVVISFAAEGQREDGFFSVTRDTGFSLDRVIYANAFLQAEVPA